MRIVPETLFDQFGILTRRTETALFASTGTAPIASTAPIVLIVLNPPETLAYSTSDLPTECPQWDYLMA